MDTTWIFILLGLLVVSVLYVTTKVIRLLALTRQKDHDKTVPAGNNTSAKFLLLFMILLMGGFWWYFFFSTPDMLPESASEHGVETDQLFRVVLGVILIPFTFLNILLFYAAFRFRHREGKPAQFYPKNNRLEVIWTTVPGIVFTILIVLGISEWDDIKSPAPDDAEVVEVMGYQFAWAIRYPGQDETLGERDYRLIDTDNLFGMDFTDASSFDDFTPMQLHIPKGKPVLLKIFSRDVIHSVFLPHFRVKMDAVPGMPTRFWFTPRYTTEEMREKTGNPDFNYEMACTEVCGRGHFAMRMVVVVDEPEDYEAWKSEQQTWLQQHPEYLAEVPPPLRGLARSEIRIRHYRNQPCTRPQYFFIKLLLNLCPWHTSPKPFPLLNPISKSIMLLVIS